MSKIVDMSAFMVHFIIMLSYCLHALCERTRAINTHSNLRIVPEVSGCNQLVFAFISKCN